MRKIPPLAPVQIEGSRRLDSATVANSVERLGCGYPIRVSPIPRFSRSWSSTLEPLFFSS